MVARKSLKLEILVRAQVGQPKLEEPPEGWRRALFRKQLGITAV